MTIHHAHYQLANTANYRFNITKIGSHEYDPLAYFYKSDFPDVEVTRPGTDTDLERVHNTCLVTVNGYVHSTSYGEARLYIPQATASMLRSRANINGLIDFSAMTTALIKTPITPAMVSEDLNTAAYDKVFIAFAEPVTQPLLVLAGYIIPYDEECFYRVSDNVFALRLSKLNYMERLYELSRYRDIFKELNVQVSPLNPQMVDAQEVRSLEVIRRLLSLHNSFLVDLSVENLTIKRSYPEHSRIPGTFIVQGRPRLPLFTGYGKVTEYSVQHSGENRYNVYAQDCHYNNHLISHMSPAQCKVYNDSRVPGQTHGLAQAFFLDFSTEK